jgi:zinc/manganese transport system substrate-binding protein
VIALLALTVNVVAAENFYGDVARQIGGPNVAVTSILNNPDQDPHLFEVDPKVARTISSAQIVVYNGIDYDPWVDKLLGAARNDNRTTIAVASLIGKKPGDNPHVWYDPQTMLAYATALATTLAKIDPAHSKDYAHNLQTFVRSLQPVERRITELRKRFAGTPVTATEPVFGYMLDALGMQVRNTRFQTAVMNNTEPGATEVAAFENDLRRHQVRMLVYNSQASDPVAQRMLEIAKSSGIPVVGATETEPPGKEYQAWMMDELNAVQGALSKASP